jgi:hypothetical protein
MPVTIVPQQSLWSISKQSESNVQSLFRAFTKIELQVAMTLSPDTVLVAAPSPTTMDVLPASALDSAEPSVA